MCATKMTSLCYHKHIFDLQFSLYYYYYFFSYACSKTKTIESVCLHIYTNMIKCGCQSMTPFFTKYGLI